LLNQLLLIKFYPYTFLNSQRASASKANILVVKLPSAASTFGPLLAVTVLNNTTENPLGNAKVSIANSTSGKTIQVTTYVNGLVSYANFKIGDMLSVKVMGMASENSIFINTASLPQNSYITTYSFVTP